MKSTKTLVLAASILALTLSTFPDIALAGTTTAALHADPDLTRQRPVVKGSEDTSLVILAADNLIRLLVP